MLRMVSLIEPFTKQGNSSISANRKGPYYRTGLVIYWLPFVDTYRSLCLEPMGEAKDTLSRIQEFRIAI